MLDFFDFRIVVSFFDYSSSYFSLSLALIAKATTTPINPTTTIPNIQSTTFNHTGKVLEVVVVVDAIVGMTFVLSSP